MTQRKVTALTRIKLYRGEVAHDFLENDTFEVSDAEYVKLYNMNIIKLITKEGKRNGD